MHEARLYDRLGEGSVRCRLCRHACTIRPDKTGICGVRKNVNGTLFTLVYDRVAAAGADPIEKKPLFHFYPGTLSFSIATPGCNFRCRHCQNADLSATPSETGRIEGRALAPAEIAERAKAAGCRSIAYTYTEPTIFAELALDTARAARRHDLANVFVTNGFMSAELIGEMKGLIDAANVDLKAWSPDFYREVCGASLDGVLESIRLLHEAGLWLEITTLVIPGKNDDAGELRSIARFISGLDRDIPWHVSRFHPCYRLLDAPPTPPATLFRAREIGLEEGLHYIYTGNIPGRGGEDTECPRCGTRVIERAGFFVSRNRLVKDACPECGQAVAGVF